MSGYQRQGESRPLSADRDHTCDSCQFNVDLEPGTPLTSYVTLMDLFFLGSYFINMAAERKRLRLLAARATKLAEEEIARSERLMQPKTHDKSAPKVPSVPQPAFHPSSSKRVTILEPSTRLETKPAPMTKQAPVTKPAPKVTKPAPTVTKPGPTVTKPAPTVTKPAPTVTKPAPSYKEPTRDSLRFPTPPKKTQEGLNRILVNLSQEANDLRYSVNTVERNIAMENDRTFSRCEVLACLAASLAEEWPSSVESIVRGNLAYRHKGVRLDTSSKEMRMVEGLLKLTATITSTQEGYLYLHNSPAGQAALVTFSQFITEIPIPSGETIIRELLLVILNLWHRPHDMEYFERRYEHFEVIRYIFGSRESSETLLHLTLLLLLFVITGVQSAVAYRNLNHFIPKDRLTQIAVESKNLEIIGVAQDIMNAWNRSAQQFTGRGDP
uniref:Uncharacterized protein n=1 Tax=Timema poppense TaxID=170557 RepID=A0A7R9D468_TIMPO|nr:unnamed protein product [Timema poppensis]